MSSCVDVYSAKSGDQADLFSEIESLRCTVQELNEGRENDRKSILILQSQIDHMRGYKCSDSFEASFKNAIAIAGVIWNQVPSFSPRSFLGPSRRSRKGKVSSKNTSCNSSVRSRRVDSNRPRDRVVVTASVSEHPRPQLPFKVAKLPDNDEIRILS